MRHYHVIIGTPSGPVIAEKEYEDPRDAVVSFVKLASSLFRTKIKSDPTEVENELYKMMENESEEAMVIGGPAFRLCWIPCDTCNPYIRN